MVIKTPPHLGGHMNTTHVDEGILQMFFDLGCRTLADVGCGPGGTCYKAEELGYTDILGIDHDYSLKCLKTGGLGCNSVIRPRHFGTPVCLFRPSQLKKNLSRSVNVLYKSGKFHRIRPRQLI